MSIAVLNQVYDETRRLAIAGSNLAKDDFRLRKLIAPLEKADAKAPVFAQLAKLITNLIDGPEKQSPQALLDLSSLITAVMYTQGTTAVKGTIKPLKTTAVNISKTQTSARLLKPLIEALTTTGSGRLNTIKESFEIGAVEDLRLVNYAIGALDDKYGEIAEFVADKVLPSYGRAICPLVQEKIKIKGTTGSARRLKLLHRLAPETARPLVLDAFENGNKEMKIGALACLGDSDEDLPLLHEQAKAKNKEVRSLALSRLAKFSDEQTVELFTKALNSKDLSVVVAPMTRTTSKPLVDLVIKNVKEEVAGLADLKQQAKINESLRRLLDLLSCLQTRSEKSVVKLLGELFENYDEWIPTGKSIRLARESLLSIVTHSMLSTGDTKLLKALAAATPDLHGSSFTSCFLAARYLQKPQEVYRDFSNYYTMNGIKTPKPVDKDRKKIMQSYLSQASTSNSWAGHTAIQEKLFSKIDSKGWDSKWIDDAVQQEDINALHSLVDGKNKKVHGFVESRLEKLMKSKDAYDASGVLRLAIASEHPKAANMLMEALKKFAKMKNNYYSYWLCHLIGKLPKSAVKVVEKEIASLPEKQIDEVLPHLQALKNK